MGNRLPGRGRGMGGAALQKMKWQTVPGWEDAYEASDTGCVRSKDREIVVRHPNNQMVPRRFRGRVLKPTPNPVSGYLMVSFTGPGRPRIYFYVHDLVLLAFVGPKPAGLEVCHDDGVRTNNRLSNLRYDTRKANAQDRRKHGKPYARGEQTGSAKLTNADVRDILALAGNESQRALARQFGVSHSAIGSILRGETWAHVQ